jgi:hypothetical protein
MSASGESATSGAAIGTGFVTATAATIVGAVAHKIKKGKEKDSR